VVDARQQKNNGVMQSVSKQRNCKHDYNNRCSVWGPCRRFIGDSKGLESVIPSHSRDSMSQGHGAVVERSCEGSVVKR
jgi:hypothetical protein